MLPCTPQVVVTNICDEATPGTPADAFSNYVSYGRCPVDDDIAYYIIYYSESPGAALVEVGEIGECRPVDAFEHKPEKK